MSIFSKAAKGLGLFAQDDPSLIVDEDGDAFTDAHEVRWRTTGCSAACMRLLKILHWVRSSVSPALIISPKLPKYRRTCTPTRTRTAASPAPTQSSWNDSEGESNQPC